MNRLNSNIDGSNETGSLAAFASEHGLKLVQRGAYGRLMMGEQKLVVARGLDWAQSLRAWLDGWAQSQVVHKPSMVSGRVSVTVDAQEFLIKYHWVLPKSLVPVLSQDFRQMVEQHVPTEIKKGATRGLMCSLETDGGAIAQVHGWWYSGQEEEELAAVDQARWKARNEARKAYFDLLKTTCQQINEQYDTAQRCGEQIFLSGAARVHMRVTGHAVQRFVYLTVPVLDAGKRLQLKLGSKCEGGIGDGDYSLESSSGNRVGIVVPAYPTS